MVAQCKVERSTKISVKWINHNHKKHYFIGSTSSQPLLSSDRSLDDDDDGGATMVTTTAQMVTAGNTWSHTACDILGSPGAAAAAAASDNGCDVSVIGLPHAAAAADALGLLRGALAHDAFGRRLPRRPLAGAGAAHGSERLQVRESCSISAFAPSLPESWKRKES